MVMSLNQPASGSNQALQKNQILQASHHLMTMLDSSKKSIENVIDSMPNLYGVIDRDGVIVKGNNVLAKLVSPSASPEKILKTSIKSIFPEASWRHIQERMRSVQTQDDFEILEVAVLEEGQSNLIFRLHLRLLATAVEEDLLEVFGVDVTTIRSFEQQLAQIFKTIPLGIFRTDATMQIHEPYSSYSEVILGEKDLKGKNAYEILFDNKEVQWTKELRDEVNNLKGIVGFSPFQFDILRDYLPKVLKIKNPPQSMTEFQWIGINFDPIIENDVITGFLVVLEDRTNLELDKEMRAIEATEEKLIAERLLQTKRIPEGLRVSVLDDLTNYREVLANSSSDNSKLKGTVHSIKGTARSSGLRSLTEVAHQLEDEYNSLNDVEFRNILKFKVLEKELDETLDVLSFYVKKQDSDSGHLDQNILHKICQSVFSSSLAYSDVNLSLEYDSDEFYIDSDVRTLIKECCTHIISNAVAHGFDDDTIQGRVRVKVTKDDLGLKLVFSDNGRGIDEAKLMQKAILKGYISEIEAKQLDKKQRLELIFAEELSTKDQADQLGGRGVGLSAIKSSVSEAGGSIEVNSMKKRGTVFTVMLPLT